MAVELTRIVERLDQYLRHSEVTDYAGAANGLQVQNSGSVSRVAAAVDASGRSIDEAARRGCDLLVVHHGLFWDGNPAVTGRRYRRLKAALSADVAIY
jgi:putative NIF3 family GTP cyclohydrolase 1 type 2